MRRPKSSIWSRDSNETASGKTGAVHVLETLDGWAQAITERPNLKRDWTLVVAGWDDGGHLESIKAGASALGLHNAVHFPGPMHGAEKEALLHHASAFILASHSEGLPMAVLEAWAYATPVFMTRACNLSEGFEAGAAVEITVDPPSIARALLAHLDDPGLGRIGAAGRALAEERFTWGQVSDELFAVYRWLVDGGEPPPTVRCV